MAGSSRIKGITIEIDGETTGLQKALSNITQESMDIQKELKDVDRLLKFDPGNTEALAQKQKLLAQQIEVTSKKLEGLKNAQDQVEKQFASGDIGEDQYRSFRREIEYTEGSIKKLKQSLGKIDNGSSVKSIKTDLSQVSEEADNAGESVKGLGSELTNLVAGAAAGVGISEVVEKAFDTSSLNTKIDISFNVPEESKESVKEAINVVSSYGVDAESALEGIRRQWALNKDASDESNSAVVKGAATIVAAYGDVDFTELIQETNELSKTLGISNEDAIALTYSLLNMGFPPDQIDIISEYGTQLKMAGFNAQEIQAIMAAGVDTGTWNIDNLLDGIKEGRIKLAEFGVAVDDTTASLLEGTNISKEQLQSWGQQVAKGGTEGTKAMQDVSNALMGVSDETTRNALGVAIFGTKWEDQGTKITEAILGMDEHLNTTTENQNNLNNAVGSMDSDPMVQLQKAMADLKLALAPLLQIIAEVIGKFAQWVSDNPKLAATIAGIVTTLGILLGIVAGLAPIITMITSILPLLTGSFAAIAAPVLIVIGVIAALVAVGVLLYQNWDTIKAKAAEIWEGIKAAVGSAIDGIVNFFTVTIPEAINSMISWFQSLPEQFAALWETIKTAFTTGWEAIVTFFTESIPAWIESVGQWFLQLPDKIAYALGYALGKIIEWGTNAWNYLTTNVPKWIDGVTKFFSELPGKIWTWLVGVVTNLGTWGSNVVSWISTNVSAWITNIVTFFSELPSKIWTWLVNVVTNVKTWGANMLTEAKTGMQNVFNGIVNTFTNLPSKMLEIGKNIVAGIKNGIKAAWDGMVGWIGGLCDSFVNGVKDALDIHSPSRVMEALGEYTGQGFQIGIASTVGDISKQADALANAAIPNVQTSDYSVSTNGLNTSNLTGLTGNNLDVILAKMDSLVEVFNNMGIYLDTSKVGKLVAPTVSSNLAFSSGRKGF